MTLSAPVTLRLEPEMEARLKSLSARSGVSVSELVRQMANAGMTRLETDADATSLKGGTE